MLIVQSIIIRPEHEYCVYIIAAKRNGESYTDPIVYAINL